MPETIPQDVMTKIVNQLVTHNGYNFDDMKIIGNTIETLYADKVEYLEVSYDSAIDYTYSLDYELTEPTVYLKQIKINI